MGNNAPTVLFSFKVNFSRETPNDFYLSGDRVQGIVELLTNDNENDLNSTYGPLCVELVGELHDFKTDIYQNLYRKGIEVFFERRIQVRNLSSNDNSLTERNRVRKYRWSFDGLLDPGLPSSLPPAEECDPCICYYAYFYLRQRPKLSRKVAFVVFTRTPMPISIRQSLQNHLVQADIQHKNIRLCASLPNNGLAVPGQTLLLHIEIDNPLQIIIKSIRVILKQYRNIVDKRTDFIIFSTLLPGFEQRDFNSPYRQSTYELSISLDKCRVMAPTSSYKNVRYELHLQCHIQSLINNRFTLILPVICTTDHQRPFASLNNIIQNRLNNGEENPPPPTYEDFMASEILPTYRDAIRCRF